MNNLMECQNKKKIFLCIDDRSIIYRNELFENLKNKINEVVNPTNKKKVCISLKK